MVHDLSIAVVGPAVHDLYDTFRLYWNEDLDPLEKLPDAPVAGPEAGGEDAVSKIQVVRTLSGKRFSELGGESEKGILEAYLRAFATAKNYIYLENQYFTDSVITDALVEVLKKKPELELILVVPIKPDVIFYPRRQAWRIEQLRAAGGDRVGVFTRWTYRPTNGRPWVAPIYIHAKGAVIDDSWATVGSANLDGLSLDYNLLLSPLVFGETTASELNITVLPPTTGAVTPFAELMRRRLFAEHLGLVDAADVPNPTDGALNHGPEYKWLTKLWRPTAEQALSHVQAAKPEALHGFVLEYPKEDGGWLDTPRKHLAALGVHLKPSEAVVRPITGTRKFYFSTGKWDKTPELEDIKQ
jgi:phosphatidylserine/phosphatidylglycerophosphate/cardiolipin synthase-like enzyme